MVQIIPAILTNDPAVIRQKLVQFEGKVERVQIDIVDGKFAQNRTIMPDVLADFETTAALDFHLMTYEPIDWVEHCVRGLADRIIGQVEQMSSQKDFVGKVSEVGLRVGLALDLPTPISAIEPDILSAIDAVLVMSVAAGFGGQEFHSSILSKISQLDQIRARDDTPFKICVDGGINGENIAKIRRAGADEVAIGAHLFIEPFEEHLAKLQKAAYGKD